MGSFRGWGTSTIPAGLNRHELLPCIPFSQLKCMAWVFTCLGMIIDQVCYCLGRGKKQTVAGVCSLYAFTQKCNMGGGAELLLLFDTCKRM